ncbi:DUF11 domain-containing protein [Geomonas terrae]|uniref:DUF11 domain-containing protein n=1 Tax=Geomonas terrae TaxID=2562681 RepID=A0A4S1CKZ9_9BACT|nr:DUF11 domain-containing protein [Geomonas terrae]TGU74411.1 DUF11 domain-containing protein [Geomonas terrae]
MKRNLFAVLALSAVAAAAVPATALANTSAGAKVVNVVEVTYSDTSGNNKFTAAASTTTTVNLVKSALNATTAPSDGTVGGLGCLASVDTVSGGTFSAIYALSATANGADNYTFTMGDNTPSTTANVSLADITRTYTTLTYNGGIEAVNPNSRFLGSAIPVGVSAADTLLFPGGSLSGFEQNDIVLVEVAEGSSKVKRAYKVLEVTPGSPATHDNNDGVTGYTTGALSDAKPEVKGSLKLGAYENTTVTLNGSPFTFGGKSIAPAFTTPATAPTMGVPVGEMVLVKVDVKASASSVTADGFVGYTLNATNGTDITPLTCTAGFYKRSQLSIQKQVRNTAGGPWGGTANGNPGDILEYKITVQNVGGQAAKVSIKDAVPAYTTLVTNGNNFATITDSLGKSVTVTTAVDAEGQPTSINTGFGDAVPTDPNRAINFYLGDTSSQSAGGTVPSCSTATAATQNECKTKGGTWLDTYTILYQVKID